MPPRPSKIVARCLIVCKVFLEAYMATFWSAYFQIYTLSSALLSISRNCISQASSFLASLQVWPMGYTDIKPDNPPLLSACVGISGSISASSVSPHPTAGKCLSS